jgi:hypothetical protein
VNDATQKDRGGKRPGKRPFTPGGFARNQRREDLRTPPPTTGPNREPSPGERSEPTPPPRPSEPSVLPPGPPERGHRDTNRKYPRRRDR